MSKPREFAHLIRNKFGSADNINHIRAIENAPGSSTPDDAFVISPAAINTLAAGTSNSLPGHGATSQVSTVSIHGLHIPSNPQRVQSSKRNKQVQLLNIFQICV